MAGPVDKNILGDMSQSVFAYPEVAQQELAQVAISSLFSAIQEKTKDDQELTGMVGQLKKIFLPEEKVKAQKAALAIPDSDAVKASLETFKTDFEASIRSLAEASSTIQQDFTPPHPVASVAEGAPVDAQAAPQRAEEASAEKAESEAPSEAQIAPDQAPVIPGAKIVEEKINALTTAHNTLIERWTTFIGSIKEPLAVLQEKIQRKALVEFNAAACADFAKITKGVNLELLQKQYNEKNRPKLENLQEQAKNLETLLAEVNACEKETLRALHNKFVTGLTDYKYAYTYQGTVPYVINVFAKPNAELAKTQFIEVTSL